MIDSSKLSILAGKTVTGPDGDSIGRIKDVYESTEGGGGTFATVATGMFGSGAGFFPLEAAELRGDEVVVPFDKDTIKDAPRVENDEELTASEEQRLFEYYSGSGATTGDAKEAVPVERVRLDKEAVTEQAQVTEDVRKEQIDLEGDAVYPAGDTAGTRADSETRS